MIVDEAERDSHIDAAEALLELIPSVDLETSSKHLPGGAVSVSGVAAVHMVVKGKGTYACDPYVKGGGARPQS